MEKSNQSSFLKSVALAFGDGLLFGVAMKLAQGPSKTRGNGMTGLGPLAERLRKVEDLTQTIDKNALLKFGEGLDGRVLEKVVAALEARLTEHVGQVDRRLAEVDAQVALDLKAVDTHTAAQTNAVEKAIEQIEVQVRDYVVAAQQSSAEQISGVDRKLSALQEALPVKFREIIEAVRQSMEARVALELTELENRVSSRAVAPEQLQELQASLRGEVEALTGKLATEMSGLAEYQQSQTAPLQQALLQLETKLTTLREELPPKIRQIVEAVEASMDARISAADRQAADRAAGLEHALAALRAQMPSADGFQQAVDENLRRHAEKVGALDQKLTVLQEELPPKIKAIVDAVRESLDARMAVELQSLEERQSAQIQLTESRFRQAQEQFRQPLEQNLARLQTDLAATDTRMAVELQGMEERHRAQIQQTESRLHDAQEQFHQPLEQNLAKLQADLAATDARMAVELQSIEERHSSQAQQTESRLREAQEQFHQRLAVESKTPALEQNVAELRADLTAMDARRETRDRHVADHLARLEQHAAQVIAGVSAELGSLQAQHSAQIEQLEARLRADRAAENVPVQIDSAVAGLRQSLEAELAAEIHDLEARTRDLSPDLEKALQYASILEARVQALEQKLQRSAEETVDRAVERVWQALDSRLQQRQAQAPPAVVQPAETITGLRQRSTSAERSVLDLIAGIGQLFEKPAARIEQEEPPPETAPPVVQMPAALEPEVAAPAAEAPVVAAHAEPEPVAADTPPTAESAPEARVIIMQEPAAPPDAAVGAEEIAETASEEKPPVILFKPKDSGRKWRIPFVSSFLLMALAIAWLQLI